MGKQLILANSSARLIESGLGILKQLYGAAYRWILSLIGYHPIHTTQQGVEICVSRGKKTQNDFVVLFKDPRSGRWRTPKHIHLIVELYVKEAHNPLLTYELRDHLIKIFDRVRPIISFPPSLQVYQPGDEQRFQALDAVGEFSVEFLLIVSELIFIQEKTNYPHGSLTKKLYEAFGQKDRFTVVQMATTHRTNYGKR